MIVSLDELKRVLGIDPADVSQDENLTRLIGAKTAWVEGSTHRRFDTPIAHVQYAEGGVDRLFLEWHADVNTTIHVFRRPVLEKYRAWEELIVNEDWERQDQTLVFLRAWQIWPYEDEFKLEYNGGYAVAPEDIKEVILEMAMNQYLADAEMSGGTAGLSSEKLGDYNYSIGSSTSAVGMAGALSTNSNATINRYKRKFV